MACECSGESLEAISKLRLRPAVLQALLSDLIRGFETASSTNPIFPLKTVK